MARKIIGTILSDKMNNTAVVQVERIRFHPKVKRYYKRLKKFKAHNAENAYHTGDKVVIEETRPLSKEKHWKIVGKA